MVTARTLAGILLKFWRFKMTEETKLSVSEMLRLTGANTHNFMEQVAEHMDALETEVVRLRDRVSDLERHVDDLK